MWIPHKFKWMLGAGAVHITIDYMYYTFVYILCSTKLQGKTLVNLKLRVLAGN